MGLNNENTLTGSIEARETWMRDKGLKQRGN
jgi:hypothetical protein